MFFDACKNLFVPCFFSSYCRQFEIQIFDLCFLHSLLSVRLICFHLCIHALLLIWVQELLKIIVILFEHLLAGDQWLLSFLLLLMDPTYLKEEKNKKSYSREVIDEGLCICYFSFENIMWHCDKKHFLFKFQNLCDGFLFISWEILHSLSILNNVQCLLNELFLSIRVVCLVFVVVIKFDLEVFIMLQLVSTIECLFFPDFAILNLMLACTSLSTLKLIISQDFLIGGDLKWTHFRFRHSIMHWKFLNASCSYAEGILFGSNSIYVRLAVITLLRYRRKLYRQSYKKKPRTVLQSFR